MLRGPLGAKAGSVVGVGGNDCRAVAGVAEGPGAGFSTAALGGTGCPDGAGCASVSAYDLCGVHCPELPAFFLGSGSWGGEL
jgi:hypothetical protein